MSVIPIVFATTRGEMRHERRAGGHIEMREIAVPKGAEQQFRLIPPTGMRRRVQDAHCRLARKPGAGLVRDMRRAVVENEVNASRPAIAPRPERAVHGGNEMRTVVRIEAAAPDRTVIHIEQHEKIDGAVADVLKLMARLVPRLHRLRGTPALQRLEIGLLIEAEHHFASLLEPLDALVAPEHARRRLAEPLIDDGSLPV